MCVISSSTVYWIVQQQEKKIAVIDAIRLFDQFDMKKELEGKSKLKLQDIARRVDSIKNILNMAQVSKDIDQERQLAISYKYTSAELEASYAESNKDINEQVWKRLNAFLTEYGKDKKLHLIIGANGMGSVLYNDSFYDLTDDAIKFANKKYSTGI